MVLKKSFFAFLIWMVNNCAYKDYDKMAERDFQNYIFGKTSVMAKSTPTNWKLYKKVVSVAAFHWGMH